MIEARALLACCCHAPALLSPGVDSLLARAASARGFARGDPRRRTSGNACSGRPCTRICAAQSLPIHSFEPSLKVRMTTIGRRPPYTALAQPRPGRIAPRVRQLQGLDGVSRAATALATAASGPGRPGAGCRSRSPCRRPGRTSGSGTAGSRHRKAPRASRGPARSRPATPSSPRRLTATCAPPVPEQRVVRPGQVVHVQRPAVREPRPCEPVELGREQVLGDRAAVRVRVDDDRFPASCVAAQERPGVGPPAALNMARRSSRTSGIVGAAWFFGATRSGPFATEPEVLDRGLSK